MAGAARRSPADAAAARVAVTLLAVVAVSPATAESLYKYRGEDGEWIYTDRPPEDGEAAEVRTLQKRPGKGAVRVSATEAGDSVRFLAENNFFAPVELRLTFTRLESLERPQGFDDLGWVLPPKSTIEIMKLPKVEGGIPSVEYTYEYHVGDPRAVHRPTTPYRVPYALATRFPVTQAYPDVVTHFSEASRYAVDIAMPIGTDIFAAREGIVFDVSSDSFSGGLDPATDGPKANVVQILHDDGTYAVYAHLNWNSIRVSPGDRVVRGQYIADSGNTGFSSGPHLHFVVLRNTGMRAQSLPFQFAGPDFAAVTPVSGNDLTAY